MIMPGMSEPLTPFTFILGPGDGQRVTIVRFDDPYPAWVRVRLEDGTEHTWRAAALAKGMTCGHKELWAAWMAAKKSGANPITPVVE